MRAWLAAETAGEGPPAVSVKAVQTNLGHASATVTLNVYGHFMPDDEDRTRAAVDLVLGASEDQLRTETVPG
jgi:hypothetical protein